MDGGNTNDQLMKLTEQDFDLIQRHLSDTLDEKSKMTFDSKIKNEAFQAELIRQAQMIDALAEVDYLDVKAELSGLDASAGATAMEPKKSSMKWPWILLALAGLLALAWVGYNQGQASKTNPMQFAELAEKHNVVYPPILVERGTSTEVDPAMLECMKSYANEDWQGALEKLKLMQPMTSKIRLYISNCHIQLGDYNKALIELEAFSSNDPELSHNQEWYKVISYLGKKDRVTAKALLENIVSNPDHLFFSKAKQLLTELP